MVEKIFVLLLITIHSFNSNAQTDSIANETIELVNTLDTWPEYKGGNEKLIMFIQNNLQYPLNKESDTLIGKVYIQMLVDTLGNTHDHKLLRGINNKLDNEALRVARLVKFEEPAKQRGKPIEIRYILVIKFNLPQKDSP